MLLLSRMYGYFDLTGSCLKNNERVVFTSYYCRLCYCLWNKGGQKARFLTTYDAAVYNLIMAVAGKDERPPHFSCRKIKTDCKELFKDDPVGNVIADLSVLGLTIKVKDNETDGDQAKAFFANLLYHKLFDKTIASNQALYEASYATIRKMDRLQQANAPIEEVLSLYGMAMENGFRYFFDAEDKYFHCINRLARWTFLLDMIEDYDSDRKLHRPNSLIQEDSATLAELFDKHYFELIPFLQKEMNELNNALLAIENEMTEWVVVNKLVRHSMATLIPNVLNGKDIGFHYFQYLYKQSIDRIENKITLKKYEKSTNHHKGN